MSNNLPARSNSRQIQRAHKRRVRTREGVKDLVINPKVKRKLPVKTPPNKVRNAPRNNQPLTKPIQKLPIITRWQDSGLKPDDGTAQPVGNPKTYDIEDVTDEMDFFPTRNVEDFEKEYIIEPLQELNKKIKEKEIDDKEAKKEFDEIVGEANAILYDDEAEPAATIVYSDDEDMRGTISEYTEREADGIDITWKQTGGYRGYNDVVLPPDSPWEVLHQDNILAMSEDSQNLKTFHELLKEELDERGIQYATVFTTSSNLFSQGLTFLIEKGRSNEVKGIVKALENTYRKEEDYLAEINPLLDGVKEAKAKGASIEDMKKMITKTDDENVRRTLRRAINKAYGDQ